MAIAPEIWEDLHIRLRNLRADAIGQWQGDIDNVGIEQTVTTLGNALRSWEMAKPIAKLPTPPTP